MYLGDYFNQMYMGWRNWGPDTYIKVKPGTDIEKIRAGLIGMIQKNNEEEAAHFNPVFRKITDLHFDSTITWVNEGAGDMEYIYIFASIAFLILIIAAINYMNLATARSVKRSKEIGLRKTLGSSRKQLIAQFLGESALTTLFATFLSIGIVLLSLPLFNRLSQQHFVITDVFSPEIVLALILIAGILSVIAGIYPALYLSKFDPVEVLKGRFSTGKGPERFRKTLVVFQFSISVILIICTGIMMNQMNFIGQSRLSRKGDQILSIRFGGNAPAEKYRTFKTALLKNPDISIVTMGNHLPRQDYFGSINVNFRFPTRSEDEHNWGLLNVDNDFPEAFELELLTGRLFEKTEGGQNNNYLINESGVRTLGLSESEVLGLSLQQQSQDTSFSGKIIGVVKDFPFRSLRQSIEPLLITTRPNPIDKIVYVNLSGNQIAAGIAKVEEVWKGIFPGVGFDYWFINEEFSRMYVGETRMSALIQVFALLAIIVACLGVFGLASYLADRKSREIGIRKILGARVYHILGLLSRTFIITIAMATIIGAPISYLLMKNWLGTFVYHVDMSFWVFLGAIGLVFLFTIISTGFETIRAAYINPVNYIRDE